jgi:hypothetical protein
MDLVTVYLVFTLVAGVVKDVDAFVDRDDCLAQMERGRENLRVARIARPELAAVDYVGCSPLDVVAPEVAKPVLTI